MLDQIEDFCLQYGLIPPGAHVLACVSGGVDSMCMLSVLERLRDRGGFTLSAAHFNHKLRGAESDGDEAFVGAWCRERGIPLYTGSGDVALEARRRGRGIEETARELRYGFFHEVADTLGNARIATAHNAGDNLETVLMRIVRGTGLRGLGGIPPVSGRIIRPLLCVTREEIEAYCRENGVPHREDSSNESDEFVRNRLRHTVIPALKALNPSLNVTGMTRLLRQDEAYLAAQAAQFLRENASGLSVSAGKLSALPAPVASRAVRALFGEKLGSVHVEAVLALARDGGPSDKVSLPGFTVRREYDVLTAAPAHEDTTFEETEIPLDRPVIIEDIRLKIECVPYEPGGIYNSLTNFPIKRDKIKAGIYVRPRRTGDVLRLPGGSRSVKKLMIDRKIPASTRNRLPVFVSGDEVLAVYGLGQSVDSLPAGGEPAVLLKTEKAEE